MPALQVRRASGPLLRRRFRATESEAAAQIDVVAREENFSMLCRYLFIDFCKCSEMA